MPNGKLNIGINEGDATVWNPQPAIQQFTNLLAQRQAKQQQEQAEIAKELASVRPDGLRNDADREAFFKQYQDIKNQGIAAQYERDPMKKAMAKAQVRQGMLNLQDYVNRSKQAGQRDNAFLTTASNPETRHKLTDDSVTKGIANTKLALTDPNYQSDYTFLQRQVDHNKINDEFQKLNDYNLKQTQWSDPIQSQGVDRQGNKTGVVVYNQRQLTPDQILANQAHLYDVNDDVKESLEQRYGNIQGSTPAETKMMRIRQNAIDRGDLKLGANGELQSNLIEKSKPTFKPDREPDRFYEHYNYEHRNDNTSPVAPQNINLPYNGGKANVNVQNYVPLSLPSKNFAGQAAYDLSNGRQIPSLESSDAYSVVGVGNFPFIKKGYGKLDGTIAQPSFENRNPNDISQRPMVHVQKKLPNGEGVEDYLVDYNKLPENIKNSKPVKQALAKFKPSENATQTVNQPKVSLPKQISSDAEYKALPKGSQYIAPDGKVYTKK